LSLMTMVVGFGSSLAVVLYALPEGMAALSLTVKM
jgi:hypothetical protein